MPAEEAQPIVEEPESPEIVPEEIPEAPVESQDAVDVSEDEKAEPDVTDEE